jgi:WD40 repeat protein
MDVEKEVFDLVYSSDETIYSLSQQSNDPKCLYFAEGCGGMSIWDERTGNISAQWSPHDDRINSIDFNSENANIITTSSTDGTASIWDLRSIDADKFKSLKTVGHKRAVHSAYFSPSGRSLVTTRSVIY